MVSEVRIAAVAGVSPPRSSRAPRSSFSFSLVPGTERRDSSCAAMARFICLMSSTGAATPIPTSASQTMPTSASPLSITNTTETSRMKMHHTPTPIAARILVSTAHPRDAPDRARECHLWSVREPHRSDAPSGTSPSCFRPKPGRCLPRFCRRRSQEYTQRHEPKIQNPRTKAPVPGVEDRGFSWVSGSKVFWSLPLLEVLSGCTADGTLLWGLDALQLLAAGGADHRDGHRRVWGFSILGFDFLSRVTGEVCDRDLACYDVLHRGACPCERVLDEGEIYVRRAALAGELLGHVAGDVAHKALGSTLQAFYGVVGPGKFPGAALGDAGAGLLEGAVVDGALRTRSLLHLLFGVADGAAAGLYFGGFTARLLAVLLLDVLARDRRVALLERALLDARLDAALLLPLFERVEQGRGVVGPVQLAAVVDLGEVQVLVLRGRCYVGVHGMEVGRARAADRTFRWFALRNVAADVAFEAVLALGCAPDLVLNLSADTLYVALVLALAEAAATSFEDLLLRSSVAPVRAVLVSIGPVGLLGGTFVEIFEERVYGLVFAHRPGSAHLVSDGAHRLHSTGGEDALYDLIDDACGYDRVALLDGVTDDGARRHADDEAWYAVEPFEGLLRPRHVLFRGVEVGGLVLVVGYQDVRRQVAHHVLGVAADVHLVVRVVADAAHNDHRRDYLVHVLQRLLERLASEERRLQIYAFVLGYLPCYLQVRRVDLGQSRVDDLLV